MHIRDTNPPDFPRILALNEESVHFLSPLNAERLAGLHAQSAYHRVAESDGSVQGFLLVLKEGARYDSPNYLWFSERFPRFLYVDRVVIADSAQGKGVGRLLYEDLFRFAKSRGAGMITCEFDVEPPNLGSQRFHERFGFKEVGTQRVGASKKLVSLQAVTIEMT